MVEQKPSKSSKDAPPPVEMWDILSAKPAFSIKATKIKSGATDDGDTTKLAKPS